MLASGSTVRLAFLGALVWALGVTACETATLPVGDLSPVNVLLFIGQELVPWMAAGLVWAFGARLAEQRTRWIMPLLLPSSLAATFAAQASVELVTPPLDGSTGALVRHMPIEVILWYFAWGNLFYGHLYLTGFLLARRDLRGRARLATQRRERSDAESRLREATLRSLEGQLQPDLLLDALGALETRFVIDPADGHRLFDDIIAFLRAAMPGVRHHRSTLAHEIDTLRRYASLQTALGRQSPRLEIGPMPDTDVAFPPLLLLPLLDALTRGPESAAGVSVSAAPIGGSFRVAMTASGPTPAIVTTLETVGTGLTAVGGTVSVSNTPGSLDILMTIPVTPPPPAAAFHDHEGVQPCAALAS